MRAGMNRETGQLVTGWDHCVQCILVILTTEIGARVMRRAFGSAVHQLQDRNPDGRTIMLVFVAIAAALRAWEPGFRLQKITPIAIGADGVASFSLDGIFYPRGHLGDYTTSEPRGVVLANDSLQGWRVAA